MLKNIEKSIEMLKKLKGKQQQQKIREGLSELFKAMGYGAISEEILNNREAKRNALFGLKMCLSDKKSNRYNTKGETIWVCPPEKIEKLKWFESEMKDVIELLEDNTENQKKYLKLKLDYDNANFEYNQRLFEHDEFIKELDRKNNDNWKEELEKWKKETYRLEKIKKDAENKLDNFVMNNLKS